jgi:hypothetical protein
VDIGTLGAKLAVALAETCQWLMFRDKHTNLMDR